MLGDYVFKHYRAGCTHSVHECCTARPRMHCGPARPLIVCCAPPGQSVSQPKHPDSKQCHILEILRRSTPPAVPQVRWKGIWGLRGWSTSPQPLGVGMVRTWVRFWVGECCEIVVWVKWPLIVSGISGEVEPPASGGGHTATARHRTLCFAHHRHFFCHFSPTFFFFTFSSIFLIRATFPPHFFPHLPALFLHFSSPPTCSPNIATH